MTIARAAIPLGDLNKTLHLKIYCTIAVIKAIALLKVK